MNVELPMSLLDWINPDKICWEYFSWNSSEGAMQLLEKNPDKIRWWHLSENPSAMRLLEKNLDKIDWYFLSNNSSEGAIQLLEKNQDKINWDQLFKNPHIFKYDYKQMKISCMLFKEDLIKNRFHPRNIPKFKDWRIDGFDSDSDLDEK